MGGVKLHLAFFLWGEEMTQSQISCFLAVAKYRSFSKAAKHLMISQPAISHQISKLELELDLLVFDRTGREVNLTEAGAILQDFYIRAQADFADALEEARMRQNSFSGTVLLGYPDGWEVSPFYDMLNDFQGRYPNVHIELVSIPLGDIESALLNGRVHAAITTRYAIQHPEQVASRVLFSVRNALLYSRKFPVSPDRPVTLADFKGCTFFLATSDNIQPFRMSVRHACEKCGFIPQMTNCSNLSTVLFHVQNNQGVFMGNELLLANRDDKLYANLILEDVQQPVLLVWKQGVTISAVKLFINETLYNEKGVSQKGNKTSAP